MKYEKGDQEREKREDIQSTNQNNRTKTLQHLGEDEEEDMEGGGWLG